MVNNSFKIMFLLILMMGTMITVSANSWLSAWMGLEINLLAFIPLMNNNNLMSTESSLKYFLTQALASTVFLFATMFLLMENYYLINYNFQYSKMLILSALMMKLGAAPFHFWFPNVMQGLSWFNSLILMTWQKIAPFMLIFYATYKPIVFICAILSAMIGAIGGLNQTNLAKLLAYSSINHISWMLISLMKNEMLWLSYFMIYSFLILTMILMFYIFNVYHINQVYMLTTNSKIMKFILFFNFMSLGGLPPFMGFFPKWMIIQYLVINHQFFMVFILILMALITLFFYLRLCYMAFMFNYSETNWKMYTLLKTNNMNMYMMCSSISIFGLILMSYIFTML